MGDEVGAGPEARPGVSVWPCRGTQVDFLSRKTTAAHSGWRHEDSEGSLPASRRVICPGRGVSTAVCNEECLPWLRSPRPAGGWGCSAGQDGSWAPVGPLLAPSMCSRWLRRQGPPGHLVCKDVVASVHANSQAVCLSLVQVPHVQKWTGECPGVPHPLSSPHAPRICPPAPLSPSSVSCCGQPAA